MEIRFAQAQDVPRILTLLRQVGQIHRQGRPDIFRAKAQKYGASQVLSMLDNSKTPIFVAVEEDKVLGYCFCMVKEYRCDPVLLDRTDLYIDDLCVDENCRGKGIGKALLETAREYAKMRKCYSIELNVWSCNENATVFYEAMGMTPRCVHMEQIL